MIWVIVITVALLAVAVGLWLLLRDASPQPPVSIAGRAARDAATRTTRSSKTTKSHPRTETYPADRTNRCAV